MNVMIVTPQPLRVNHVRVREHDVFFRSHPSGLKSLPVDLLILAPGVSEEQRRLAVEKTKATRGKIYELREVPE